MVCVLVAGLADDSLLGALGPEADVLLARASGMTPSWAVGFLFPSVMLCGVRVERDGSGCGVAAGADVE